jgi:hypothetical protein
LWRVTKRLQRIAERRRRKAEPKAELMDNKPLWDKNVVETIGCYKIIPVQIGIKNVKKYISVGLDKSPDLSDIREVWNTRTRKLMLLQAIFVKEPNIIFIIGYTRVFDRPLSTNEARRILTAYDHKDGEVFCIIETRSDGSYKYMFKIEDRFYVKRGLGMMRLTDDNKQLVLDKHDLRMCLDYDVGFYL